MAEVVDYDDSDLIPNSWDRVRIPLPSGEDHSSFVTRLVDYMSPRWHGAWTWVPGKPGADEIIFGAATTAQMAMLLAHVLVVTENNSAASPEKKKAARRAR